MILVKKLLRSLWRARRSYAACIFLIALGVASYTGFTQAGISLRAAMDGMYRSQRFGEAFASVQGIPQGALYALERIDGVAQASGRAVVNSRYLTGDDRLLSLRLISWDGEGLNQPLLTLGTAPGRGEIVISQSFYEAEGLSLGDSVTVVADGRQLRLSVCGTAASAEYISEVGEGMTGDGTVSGYAYLLSDSARSLAGGSGYYNDLLFTLEDDVSFRQVEPALEEALERYGLRSLYGREDHPGHREAFLSIDSLSASAAMIAGVFLSVAVLVLTIVMRRLIEQERSQIGTLKAFGFSDSCILRLYLGYGVAISLVGCALGCLGALGISKWAAGLYLELFRMPPADAGFDPGLVLSALLISLVAGLGGAFMGARSVIKLSPAESMRPAAPPQLRGRGRKLPELPTPVAMALRGISRAGRRSSFVAGGMAVAFAILSFMSSYASMMDDILMVQYDRVQLYDLHLSLQEPRGEAAAVHSAGRLPGVDNAEGVLELSGTLHNRHLQEDSPILGLTADSDLHRLYDSNQNTYVELPDSGVALSRSLAEKLEVMRGDELILTTSLTGEREFPVNVAEIFAENMGSGIYMELGGLCRLLGSGNAVNALLLRTTDSAAVKEALGDETNANTLTDMAAQRQVTQSMLDQTLGANLGVFLVIGLGVSFALVTSTASISLSERSREYATLRVLGMEAGEIGRILTLEYLVLTAAGFLPGIPLAMGLRFLLTQANGNDALYLTPWIAPVHYLVGAAISLFAVLVANLSSLRKISRLDMAEVLKERE